MLSNIQSRLLYLSAFIQDDTLYETLYRSSQLFKYCLFSLLHMRWCLKLWLSKCKFLVACKVIRDSLGFWIPRCGFWFPGILDSGFLLRGFPVPKGLNSSLQFLVKCSIIAFRFPGMTSLGGFYYIIGTCKYMETSLCFLLRKWRLLRKE